MLNSCLVMGRLTQDPVLRYTNSGAKYCSFSIAVERDYKPEHGERQTDFIEVAAWRSTAEFVTGYFSKGQMICVTGRIETGKYTDRDGNSRNSFRIRADRCYFAGSKPNSSRTQPAPEDERPPFPDGVIYVDDFDEYGDEPI